MKIILIFLITKNEILYILIASLNEKYLIIYFIIYYVVQYLKQSHYTIMLGDFGMKQCRLNVFRNLPEEIQLNLVNKIPEEL